MNAETAKDLASKSYLDNLKTEKILYDRNLKQVEGHLMSKVELRAQHGNFSGYFYIYDYHCTSRDFTINYYRKFHHRLVKDIRRFLMSKGFKVSWWPWIHNSSDAMIRISWK